MQNVCISLLGKWSNINIRGSKLVYMNQLEMNKPQSYGVMCLLYSFNFGNSGGGPSQRSKDLWDYVKIFLVVLFTKFWYGQLGT